MRTKLFAAAILITIVSATAVAQKNFEITGFVGEQFNGGLDLSTSLFKRVEVNNGISYGAGVGYLLGERYSAEFMWTYNKADTFAQPVGGGNDVKLFVLDTNQYFGNFLFHFADREKKMRPFVLVGAGATNLHPAFPNVTSVTRFAFAAGGGVKYSLTKHFGLRMQGKWSPTYITTTNAGYWCDPFWGGCWAVGNSHYLHEFDATAGVTLHF